jgi:hypothetical protein
MIDVVSYLLQVLMIALALQSPLSDIDLPPLLQKMHTESGGQKSHFLLSPHLTNRDAFVAAQDENALIVFDIINDLFYRLFIGYNHRSKPPFPRI